MNKEEKENLIKYLEEEIKRFKELCIDDYANLLEEILDKVKEGKYE